MPAFSRSYTAVAATTLTAANFNANWDAVTTFLNTTGLDSSNIQALSITNSLISTTANIAVSKLAAGTSGQVLLNTSTPTPTWTTLSGDVTVGATGVTAIGTGKVTSAMILDGEIVNADISAAAAIAYSKLNLTGNIVNADISASAAIGYSKLATLNTGQVLLGNAGTPTATTLSGDVTVGATGTTAVGTNKITAPMLATSAILLGSAQITSSFTTASTTDVQVTGLSVTVTIPAGGRSIMVMAGAANMFNAVAGGNNINSSLWDGTVGSGTQISANNSYSAVQNAPVSALIMSPPLTVSAGSKTYNVGFSGSGAGNKSFTAGASSPGWIAVFAV